MALLAISVVTALAGETLLSHKTLVYFGFVPIIWGLYTPGFGHGMNAERPPTARGSGRSIPEGNRGPGIAQVAVVTVTSRGDSIGVYTPIFAVETVAGISIFVAVFLVGMAVCCLAARYLAFHPLIARSLVRWNHTVLPAVLIGIGVWILVQGGAFGL